MLAPGRMLADYRPIGRWLGFGGAVLLIAGLAQARAADRAPMDAARLRHPIALVVDRERQRVYVANERSGSVSVVDPRAERVVGESNVGQRLSDLAAAPHGDLLFTLDRGANQLLALRRSGDAVRLVASASVPADPVSICVDGSGRCVVASSWSRRITLVDSAQTPDGRVDLTVKWGTDLPFCPGRTVSVCGGSRLIVADAFGGKLAVIDPAAGRVLSIRELPGCHIGGLALSPDGMTLIVAQQAVRRTSSTSFEGVHWGSLMNSQVRSLRVDQVVSSAPDTDVIAGGCSIEIGFATRGGADPSAVACDASGRVAVALAGVGEVALAQSPTAHVRRVGVGEHPTALALEPSGSALYVADTFSDSISVVDPATRRRTTTITLGPNPELSLVDRGERLFHDARLSHDGWMSCQSCHTDGHSNGLAVDTFGDGSYGAPKRVPSLLGTSHTGPWSWNGEVARLEDQVRKSVEMTMRGRPATPAQIEALSAYLRSLAVPATATAGADEHAVARGRSLFQIHRCGECHRAPQFTSPGRYDVGLVDEVGNRKFNPPSLLGVSRRDPYLHDGRAPHLDDVFTQANHPGDQDYSPDEVADLVAYLKTL